ncbi:tetratricopeptide repeat protein [Aeromonas sp. R6-2]|uniref:tetratricopeptide repeat protein n=1 Tax=unclassified Aeromonas TaxID=257493 RepID=UPI0034A3106D
MKKTISLLIMLYSAWVSADVMLYTTDSSILGLENIHGQDSFTSTLYGGSNDSGATSPADCVVRYKLVKKGSRYMAESLLMPKNVSGNSSSDNGEISFEIDENRVVVLSDYSPDECPLNSNFSGEYMLVGKKDARYKSEFDSLIKINHKNALKLFQKSRVLDACNSLTPYIQEATKTGYYNAGIFNDYGYFLQQAGLNVEAVDILNLVIKKSPSRKVVYLNVADAYWGMNEKNLAVKNYMKYRSLMTGNEDNIPSYILDRIK